MKRKKVWIMCGPSGSGKSTWIFNRIMEEGTEKSIHLSRDAVRFSLVSEDEEYFSKENEVFKTWINLINDTIYQSNFENIYIDATHLSKGSRSKLLKELPVDHIDLYAVNFLIDIGTCLKQNDLRSGREKVPESVIRRMYYTFEPASKNEKWKWKDIINVC